MTSIPKDNISMASLSVFPIPPAMFSPFIMIKSPSTDFTKDSRAFLPGLLSHPQ
jgi:hypothetical protein